MAFETISPAALADAGRARNVFGLQASNGSEHNKPALSLQELRAAWLARRARLPLTLAGTLAPLAFGMEAR